MDRSTWKKKTIADICDKGSSNIAQNTLDDNEGEYPVFGASGFIKNVNFYQQEKPYIGIVKDGSGVGRVNFYPAKSSLLGTMQYILPKDGYEIRWVGYALQSLDLKSFATGAAIPHIYFKDYGKVSILVPGVEEQRGIVEELDLLGGVVAAKERQLKELDALAQSTFYTMFDDPITNEKGWDIKTLENVCCGKATYGAGASAEPYTEGKSRYIRITDIDENGRLNENKVTATVDDESKYLLHNGDLLFARSGATVGKTYLYQEKDGKAIYAGYLIRFVPNKKMVDPLYLFHYTRSDFYKHWVQSMQNAVAQPNINAKQYGVLSVLVPPLDLQQAFAEKIEAIEQQKQLIRQSLVQTQNLLAATLQKYFGQTED